VTVDLAFAASLRSLPFRADRRRGGLLVAASDIVPAGLGRAGQGGKETAREGGTHRQAVQRLRRS